MNYSAGFALVFLVAAMAVEAQESAEGRGPQLLAPFKQELQQALREGLAQGPAEAIAVCSVQAPEIAASLSRDGVRMGRSSHRLRNPANVSPEWVSPIVDAYVSSASDREPRIVEISETQLGYVEPIVLQPLCLTCHGEALPADVASKIEELYPDDRATGFEVGDFRGVFWVEYPADY